MTHARHIIGSLLAAILPTAMLASPPPDSPPDVRYRLVADYARIDLQQLSWQSPAVRQWQRDYSLSHVAAAAEWRHENTAIDHRQGNGHSDYAFRADTYIKHGSSTLWGNAAYHNGTVRNMVWNETSDTHVVYPYLLADSVGGRRTRYEQYAFAGGYADHRGGWAWGVEGGYTAGLYYRSVDPRPRNVTADLHATASAGRQFGNRYLTAIAIAYRKYKQTNDVAFYSELGNEKMFHLTGPVADYGRFAGTGYNTYYKGHQWTAMLHVQPVDRRGIAAAVIFSRLTLDNVLTNLNKLPLAHIGHNSIAAEAAFLAEHFSLATRTEASRRVGSESIFADAAAAVYPQIGRLDMFYENRFSLKIAGAWRHIWHGGQRFATVTPTLDYQHVNTVYAGLPTVIQVNAISFGASLRGGRQFGRVLATANVGYTATMPTSERLQLPDTKPELAGLVALTFTEHALAAHAHGCLTARLTCDIALNNRYALNASVGYNFDHFTDGVRRNLLNTSLAFVF